MKGKKYNLPLIVSWISRQKESNKREREYSKIKIMKILRLGGIIEI